MNSTNAKLNWLRASVLGENDGIASIADLVLGVAGAINSSSIILTTGLWQVLLCRGSIYFCYSSGLLPVSGI